MKLKILPLLMLLLTVPIKMMSAQQSATNNQILENELGIDLTKTYSATDVIELCSIILEEADVSIKNAYNEGYKQAVLEYKPQLTLTENNYAKLKNNNVKYIVISGSAGIAVGFISGLLVGIKIN